MTNAIAMKLMSALGSSLGLGAVHDVVGPRMKHMIFQRAKILLMKRVEPSISTEAITLQDLRWRWLID